MPKYDFKCSTCGGSVVELHLTFDSTERPKCSKCDNPMEKVWTAPAVQFKEGGWGGQ